MPTRSLSIFAVLAAVVFAILVGRARLAPGPAAPSPGRADPGRPDRSNPPDASRYPGVGFRSRDRLEEHYQKHGREFGTESIEHYLQMAQALRDKPAGGPILEAVGRRDGHDVVSKFDTVSGSFLAYDRDDGVIRTFFRPNDGEAYFHRQAAREGHEVGAEAGGHRGVGKDEVEW